jgi:hypothetical protein
VLVMHRAPIAVILNRSDLESQVARIPRVSRAPRDDCVFIKHVVNVETRVTNLVNMR